MATPGPGEQRLPRMGVYVVYAPAIFRLGRDDSLLEDTLRGIPAVAVLTDCFQVSGREMATIEELPDYPFVVIDLPIASNPNDELRGKAERVLDSIVSLLTRRRG